MNGLMVALLSLSLHAPAPLERALEDGYQTRSEATEHPGSALAPFVALGPGAAFHGLGHYWIDQDESALRLFLIEVLGLGLIVLGEVTDDVNDGAYDWLSDSFSRAGVLLFLGSWGADLLGSFKGNSPFEPDNTRLKELKFGLAYRYTNDALTRFRHHMVTLIKLDSGLIFLKPSVELEAGLNTRRGDLDVGAYLLREHWLHATGDPQNFLSGGVKLHRLETPLYGFARHGGEGYLKLKIDLGLLIPTMRSFYIVNRGGYGVSEYQLSRTPNEVPHVFTGGDFTDTYLTWESGVELNTGAHTHFSLLFVQDPNLETAPFSAQVGLLQMALEHRYEDDLDIEARMTAGDDWAVWIELGYQL